MRIAREFIRWSSFAVVLAALGMGIFHFLRSQPRFAVSGNHEILHLSADGRWLVTTEIEAAILKAHRGVGAVPGRLHVYDTDSGRCIRTVDVQRTVAIPQGCCIGASFGPLPLRRSPDGRHFTWMKDHEALVLDWQTGEQRKIHLGETHACTDYEFSPGGRWLAFAERIDCKESVNVADLRTGHIARRFSSRVLTFVCEDRIALIWADTHRLELVYMATGAVAGALHTEIDILTDQGAPIVSPDGNWLILGHVRDLPERPRGVEVWDLVNRRRVLRFEDQSPSIIDLAFACQRGRFAMCVADFGIPRIELIDPPSSQPVTILEMGRLIADADHFAINNMIFSPDNEKLLLNCRDDDDWLVLIFDVTTGRLHWQRNDWKAISFCADGTSVIGTKGTNGRLQCLDAATGAMRAVIAADDCRPFISSLTPDGRRVLVGATIDPFRPAPTWQQWLGKYRPQWLAAPPAWLLVAQASTGQELLRLPVRESSGAISDDGATLVTWPWPGNFLSAPLAARRVEVWDVEPNRAIFWAVTWPIALGVVLLLLRHWRLKRKAAE